MGKKRKKKVESKNLSVIAFLRVSALLFPLPLYLLFTVFLFPAPNSGFFVLGIVGAFAIGLGLMNIAGLYDDTYFGHAITGIALGVGSLLILVSSFIMYIPSIYSEFDERYVTLYYLLWIAQVVCAIWYMFFRKGVQQSLRGKGISKTAIEKALKGCRNFWWYEAIQSEFNIGWIYHLNKAFTILLPVTCVTHLLFGWMKIVSLVVAVGCCVLCLICEPMWMLSHSSSKHLNTPEAKKNKYASPIALIFPILMCVAILIYLFKYI